MEELATMLQSAWDAIRGLKPEGVSTLESLSQLAVIGLLCLGAWLIGKRMHPAIVAWCEPRPMWERIRLVLEPLLWPLVWFVLLSLLLGIYLALGRDGWAYQIATSLVLAWIVVRLVSRAIRNPMLSRVTAVIAYGMAVLSIWGQLGPTIRALQSPALTLNLGNFSLNLYQVLAIALLVAVLLSVAAFLSRVAESQLRNVDWVTPTGRVLLTKTLRTGLYVLAILISISTAGLDLTALAVIGGAVGVGIGFGLRRIIGNLMSGVILLMDKSIKPGDVITVENTYGWVNKLSARYVSIITRDGIEHLIPNETLITEPVSNWTHSDALTRLRVPLGVAYGTDLEMATELACEAAESQERVLNDPAPRCRIMAFGDSSIQLEIRFWIKDASSGVANIKSAVMLELWRQFRDHGIEIPYPQREVRIRSGEISGGEQGAGTGGGRDARRPQAAPPGEKKAAG